MYTEESSQETFEIPNNNFDVKFEMASVILLPEYSMCTRLPIRNCQIMVITPFRAGTAPGT